MTSEWLVALDALEEWLRRTTDALAGRDLDLPAAPQDLPCSPVPADLQLRAKVLLDRLYSTESEGLRRRTQLTRSHAYGAV